ncbi:MAG: hypothetical protein AB7G68_14360 [Nitrospiraceae bacterium]
MPKLWSTKSSRCRAETYYIPSLTALMTRPRPLTHDERKAAEAAFRGLPPNPNWTQGALSVYHGMRTALTARRDPGQCAAADSPSIWDRRPVSV